jgi:hypothetical protein
VFVHSYDTSLSHSKEDLGKNVFRFSSLMFNATINNISDISWMKPEYAAKTTDQPQVNDNLYIKSDSH